MFYKIDKESELHQKFKDFSDSCKNAVSESKSLFMKFVEEDVDYYGSDSMGAVCGGISAIAFDKNPDSKIWKKVRLGYMPKQGTEFADAIKALPIITYDSLNALINFQPFNIGKKYFGSFNVHENSETSEFFIDTKGNKKFQPVDGMIEILYSEYLIKTGAKQ